MALDLGLGPTMAAPSDEPIWRKKLFEEVAVPTIDCSPRQTIRVGVFAVLNWSGDFICLVMVLVAIGAPVPWHGVLLAWAAGAGASSLGLTPGGLGVVEGALSIALIAAGLPPAVAVGGVLLYRFIKLWLVLAAGAVTLLVIRAKAGTAIGVPTQSPIDLPVTRQITLPRAGPVADEAT